MKQVQRGFTLIELVMVIVIIGILAAVAIPKFVDLGTDADKAAVAGVAGALSSASAINYAARSLGSGSTNYASTHAVATCADVVLMLQGGVVPTGYVNTSAATTVAPGVSVSCTLTSPKSNTATYVAIGIL